MIIDEIECRLENWARAQRSSGYAPGRAASAEGAYRGGGWREIRSIAPSPDYADAAIVQAEWRCLMPLDKSVLMMWYVWRSPASFICRRLKIKQGRGHEHVWDFALLHAQREIAKRIQNRNEVAKPAIKPYNVALMTDPVY